MPSITEIVNIYYTQDLLKEREKNKNIKKEKVPDKLDVNKINSNDTQNKQTKIIVIAVFHNLLLIQIYKNS